MFRTVRDGEDGAASSAPSDTSENSEEAAARRAERMTAAFFGASKKPGEDGGADAEPATSEDAGKAGDAEEKAQPAKAAAKKAPAKKAAAKKATAKKTAAKKTTAKKTAAKKTASDEPAEKKTAAKKTTAKKSTAKKAPAKKTAAKKTAAEAPAAKKAAAKKTTASAAATSDETPATDTAAAKDAKPADRKGEGAKTEAAKSGSTQATGAAEDPRLGHGLSSAPDATTVLSTVGAAKSADKSAEDADAQEPEAKTAADAPAKDAEAKGAAADGEADRTTQLKVTPSLTGDAKDADSSATPAAPADVEDKAAKTEPEADAAAEAAAKDADEPAAKKDAEDGAADGPADRTTVLKVVSESPAAAAKKPGAEAKSAADPVSGSEPEDADKADATSPAAKDATAAEDAKAASKADDKAASKSEEPKPKDAKATPKSEAKPTTSTSKASPRSDSESESERTSQFVPLKSTDERPGAGKPKSAVPAKAEGKPRTGSTREDAAAGTGKAAGAGAVGGGELPPEMSEAELTRQQPRPDQAPLDLLAQLTNTPPPPETPLRTAVRRVKIWTPLVVLLAIVFVIAQSVRPLPEPGLTLTASPTYTFAGGKPDVPWPSEGQAVLDVEGLGSFGSSGGEKPVPIASVAKVMTAYVILRDHPVKPGEDGKTIPVDKKAEEEAGLSAQNESTVKVKEGDKLTQREAVEAIMIASANNVARLLARWDAGSEKAFTKKMNDAAADLGMKNTEYTDPSGLNASTVSTAADQVKLAKKAMDIPMFRDTVRMPHYTDAKGDKHGNWNRLVPLDGVVGIKTGTTTKAGGNLLFAAEKEIGGTKQLIVGAVLGQYRPSILDTVLQESKKLMDTAQDELEAKKVVKKGDVVGYVDDKMGGKTPVVATEDVTAVGWSGLKVKLGLTDNGKTIPSEAPKGTKVGTLTVGDGPGQVKVPVALQEDATEPDFGSKLTRIL
nr:D-alanyl-D-alanine carboxypeptidase [Streptomyces sp. HNM0574]